MSSSNKVEVFHPIEIKYSCVCKTAEERNLFVDFIAAMKKLKEKNESGFQPSTPVQDGWVKIEDGLPSKAGKYIVYGRYAADCPMNVFQSNFYKKDKSFRTDIKTKGVTHWPPLPSPPVNKQD